MVLCEVVEYIVTGKDAPVSMSETTEIIKLPRYGEKEGCMLTDVNVNVKAQRSSNYQSVHFGVSLTLKDVDLDAADTYVDHLESIAFEKLEQMEPRAEEIMTHLLEQA